MSTTTSTSTWRDVAEQLRPYQTAALERREQMLTERNEPADTVRHWLLQDALEDARRNQLDAQRFGDVPVPRGAEHVWHFELDDDGTVCREFTGRTWQPCHNVSVQVLGKQRPDGSVTAWVFVSTSIDTGSTLIAADDARQVAECIVAAAADVDVLNHDSPPFI